MTINTTATHKHHKITMAVTGFKHTRTITFDTITGSFYKKQQPSQQTCWTCSTDSSSRSEHSLSRSNRNYPANNSPHDSHSLAGLPPPTKLPARLDGDRKAVFIRHYPHLIHFLNYRQRLVSLQSTYNIYMYIHIRVLRV